MTHFAVLWQEDVPGSLTGSLCQVLQYDKYHSLPSEKHMHMSSQ